MSEQENNNHEMTQVDPDSDDEVYQLFMEIQSEIARLKKRRFRDVGEVHLWITGTGLPLLRDLSFRLYENSSAIDELLDEHESSEETQFTLEDAKKFDFVLQFAKGVASASLDRATEDEEKAQLVRVIQTAEECLKIVEESALSEEPEEEEEEPVAAAGQG